MRLNTHWIFPIFDVPGASSLPAASLQPVSERLPSQLFRIMRSADYKVDFRVVVRHGSMSSKRAAKLGQSMHDIVPTLL